MLPVHAKRRHEAVEARTRALAAFAEEFEGNRIEWGDRSLGVIASGVAAQYVRAVLPGASLLRLGMVWPLPEAMIRRFAAAVERVVVVEELDPFIETRVKALGIPARGKDLVPAVGELDPRAVRAALCGSAPALRAPEEVPARPPVLCPGCPHRGIFHVLSKLEVIVAGDIGCYTLAALPPLSAMDTCVCMGASIGNALGMEKALGPAARGKIVAVIGDSTFVHSGITPLIDVVYNRGVSTVIILDNRTTAMTGAQDHPATGRTIRSEPTHRLDLAGLCRAVGVEHVYTVNPHDMEAAERLLRRELAREAPSVIITEAPCALLPEHRRSRRPLYEVLPDRCTGCRACAKIGCPAIGWVALAPEEAAAAGKKPGQKGVARIDPLLCDGCNQCPPLCRFQAIVERPR